MEAVPYRSCERAFNGTNSELSTAMLLLLVVLHYTLGEGEEVGARKIGKEIGLVGEELHTTERLGAALAGLVKQFLP